jgi:hypothetical protein
MKVKLFEIRDVATCLPMMAIKLDPRSEAERWLLARSGYGPTPDAQRKYVLLADLQGGGGKIICDYYDWGGCRTRQIANKYIAEHFDDLTTGDVIDVEFICGITKEPKKSDAFFTFNTDGL